MPHFTVRMREADLDGTVEPKLIQGLADAVGAVYGDFLRSVAVVEIFGVPEGRWGVGGKPATSPAPVVNLNLRAAALEIEGAAERLISEITDAVAAAVGEEARSGVTVGLTAVPPGRSGTGGAVD